METRRTAPLTTRFLTWTAIWLGIALFFAGQNVLRRVLREQELDLLVTVGFEVLYWVPWLLLTPALLYAARSWPLEGATWRRNVWPHLAAAVAISVVQVLIADALQYGTGLVVWDRTPEQLADWRRSMWVGAPILMLTAFWKYWVFMGFYYAIHYHRRYRDRELHAARLQAQLSAAQLQALKMQLHPHFLFNTLNAVAMLNFTDVDAANHVLAKLAALLRDTVERSSADEVTLVDEVEFLNRYLDIERIRFSDRLTAEFPIDDDVLDALVPSLLLQPLVENAMRHGIGKDSRAGRLEVRGRRRDGRLVLEVADDGPGLPPGWNADRDGGVGLRNVAARLAQRYGAAHRLEFLTGLNDRGLTVRITIPYRPPGELAS